MSCSRHSFTFFCLKEVHLKLFFFLCYKHTLVTLPNPCSFILLCCSPIISDCFRLGSLALTSTFSSPEAYFSFSFSLRRTKRHAVYSNIHLLQVSCQVKITSAYQEIIVVRCVIMFITGYHLLNHYVTKLTSCKAFLSKGTKGMNTFLFIHTPTMLIFHMCLLAHTAKL